jgi:hypothetical protein
MPPASRTLFRVVSFLALLMFSAAPASGNPGSPFTLNVMRDESAPLVGVKCYLFNQGGKYLGVSGVTGDNGAVSFELADGTYTFRVDHLGYRFWSDAYDVPATLSAEMIIPHQEVVITVQGVSQSSAPLSGLKVYLFTEAETYQGQSRVTDNNGQASFSVPGQPYKVRVDYLGKQFWSEVFVSQNTTVKIPMADAEVLVTGAGAPLPGVKVYVFTTGGTYLGISGTTDANGKVLFTLAAGEYKFRADYQGNRYWSEEEPLTAGQVNPVALSTGGGTFTLKVMKGDAEPLAGVKCYLFNQGGKYLGVSGVTGDNGAVSFELADGTYTFRVDHLGYRFWSDAYDVPATLSAEMIIPHQEVVITVQGVSQSSAPLSGLKVYLFTEAGTYQGQSRVTDNNGQASFSVPGQPYKVRVDYLGKQFWSEVFVSQNTTVKIPMADAEVLVTGAGAPLPGVKVYVFTTGGTYLGISGTTDANGKVLFTLAAGEYKFRADYQGNRYWSAEATLDAAQVEVVGICTTGTKLAAGDGQAGDLFGTSVSLSGDVAVIGAPGADHTNDDAGCAYVFHRNSPWYEYAKIAASDSDPGDRFGTSASIHEQFLAVGAPGDDDLGMDSGSVFIYLHDGDRWIEHSKITTEDGGSGDAFGVSLAISHHFVVAGAPGYDGGGGSRWDGSHITEFEGLGMEMWLEDHWESYYGDYTLVPTGGWADGFRPTKVRLTYNRTAPLKHFSVRDKTGTVLFGESASYSSGEELEINCISDIGQVRVVPESDYPWILGIEFYDPGEPGGEDSGAAYVLRFDGGLWVIEAKLVPRDSAAGDHFGASVSLDEAYAVVGAAGRGDHGEDSGAAYIFKFDGSTWTEQAKLAAGDAQAGDRFGASVAISGDYAVVGADFNSEKGEGSGAAYVFRRYGPVWTQQAKLTAADTRAGDRFGASVAINGSYAAVGAPANGCQGTDSGAVYLFKRHGDRWTEAARQLLPLGKAGDHFGASVAVGNGDVLSGAKYSDDRGMDSGSAGIHVIDSYHDAVLRASPETIPLGGSATLSWISVNANSVIMDQGIGTVPLNGSISVSPSVTTRYVMTAAGPYGTDTNDVTVAVNQPPSFAFIEPDGVGDRIHNRFTILWTASDPEDNPAVSLYFDTDGSGADGTLIAAGLDLGNDFFVWDTSQVPEGPYFLYAVIDDGFNDPRVVYSSNVVVVDHQLYPGALVSFPEPGYMTWIGYSVSVSGDHAIAGAPGDGTYEYSNRGAAYILRRSNGVWGVQTKLVASDGYSYNNFGHSVSIDGEYAVAGAYGDTISDSPAGSAYVFRRESSTWIEQVKLIASDLSHSSLFGWSVSIKGDYAAVGAPLAGTGVYYGMGAVYVFRRAGSSWIEEAKLTASDGYRDTHFGESVHINGDYVIVGASSDSNVATYAGSAYIFKREGSTWIEQAKLVPANLGACDRFGDAVAIDGDYAVIGAPHKGWYPYDTPKPGSAYIFKREGSAWVEQTRLLPINGEEEDNFGTSVSMSGDYALIGASSAHPDASGNRRGSAYVFKRENSMWKEFIELGPSSEGDPGGTSGGWFGLSVALSGADIVVGAPAARSGGAVYTFRLIPVTLTAGMEKILQGASTSLSWNCPEATSVHIDNGIGGVPAQGFTTVSPTATTTYTITAEGPWGTHTESVTVTVVPLTISIDSPVNGTTVSKGEVMVEGTITDAPGFEIGVSVNGVIAMVDGDYFVASHVPLQEGANTITAEAADTFGHTAGASVTVNAETSGDYVKISSEVEAGASPLETTLRVEASFDLSNASVTYTGPAVVQFLSNPNPSEYQVKMPKPGLYAFTVQATDDESNLYTDTAVISAIDAQVLDGILRQKWRGLRDALGDGDIPKAMSYIAQGARNMFEYNFTLLNAFMGEIVAGLEDIEMVQVQNKAAEYEMWAEQGGQRYSFYVLFVKDRDGIWRIEFF